MVEKTWPVLKSCKHQCYQATDLLSQLPDDLLLLIMSFLTMKEAARTSVVSHKWNYLWRCFPVLIFNDHAAMQRLDKRHREKFLQQRGNFFKWVNGVLDAHLGRTIDELRVAFDFDSDCQTHMDKWVDFALSKQVKRLELDFTTPSVTLDYAPSTWNMTLYQSHHLSAFKSCLRSLCLKSVDITTEDVDCLLRSCMVLENLCIESSPSLTYVRARDPPLQLKHLEVSYCRELKTIDISAPKLLSFIHTGSPIKLHIRNASSLLEVSVGDIGSRQDVVAYAFNALSKYFSQLEYVNWQMRLCDVGPNVEFNMGINNPPAMTNLKHLKLDVIAECNQSLLGWMKLIEASPLLQKLSVKISLLGLTSYEKTVKRSGSPLKSLKTPYLCGDLGYPIDLEFATYIIKNSILLKKVIVDFRPLHYYLSSSSRCGVTYMMQGYVARIERIVPQGCKVYAIYFGSMKRYEEKLSLLATNGYALH